MKLKTRLLGLEADKPIIVLNKEDAEDIDVRPSDRVELAFKNTRGTAIVNIASHFIKPGQIGLLKQISDHMKVKPGDSIEVLPSAPPESQRVLNC